MEEAEALAQGSCFGLDRGCRCCFGLDRGCRCCFGSRFLLWIGSWLLVLHWIGSLLSLLLWFKVLALDWIVIVAVELA